MKKIYYKYFIKKLKLNCIFKANLKNINDYYLKIYNYNLIQYINVLIETKNIQNYDIDDNENIKHKSKSSAQKVDYNDEKHIEGVEAAAVNIRDKMIKYRIYISNFKSIIKQQKQLQQATFCVFSFYYYSHTINITTLITIKIQNTFTTNNSSSTPKFATIDITTNLNNLLNVYKENIMLIVPSASAATLANITKRRPQQSQKPPKILLLLLNDKTIQTLFNNSNKTKENMIKTSFNEPNTTNTLLKTFKKTTGKRTQKAYQIDNTSNNTENQKILIKDSRLPFATLFSSQLLTPLLEETNEPLPKFLCLSPFFKTQNTICYYGISVVVIVLKFVIVIILIRIIDFFFNFLNCCISVLFFNSLLLILYVFMKNSLKTTKTLKTFPLTYPHLRELLDRHIDNNNNQVITVNTFYISLKSFIFKNPFLGFRWSKFSFLNESRWKCFNYRISNFL